MIIDGETVITGSFNFTKAAEENNAENLLVTRDRKLASLYTKNWQEHERHSEVYARKGEVVRLGACRQDGIRFLIKETSMFSKKQEELILTGIQIGKEQRNVEYKGSVLWNEDNSKQKILKSMLAMANIRDGGSVIIGVEQKKGAFELSGMTKTDFDSFNYETISAVMAEFADPYVTFSLTKDELQGKRIVIIDVEEFQDIPVICKKDGSLLKRGKLYTRGRRVPESVEVPSQTEMREILDIAIEKGVRKFLRTISKIGITLKEPEKTTDIDLFEKQLRESQNDRNT